MNAQIREAAAEWLVEFRTEEPNSAARSQFAAWLRTSPEHIRAYLNVSALWEEASGYDELHRIDIDALIALARADHVITNLRKGDAAADAVGPERPASTAAFSQRSIPRRLLGPRTAIAVLLSLAINAGLLWLAIDSRKDAFTTQMAEQRSVLLFDGSDVDLDARSELRVKFTPRERTVELVSGQALFNVKKDSQRPFVVRADGARFRAVGTQFDVNRTSIGTVLTVVEGRVTVLAGSQSSASGTGITVEAGQQVTVARGGVTAPVAADTNAVTGWTRKVLVFASTPLPVVAEELNRFNWRQVTVASPDLVHFEVTGTFRPVDPETLPDFILYLRRQSGLEVLEQGDHITVQSRSTHP